MRCFRAFPILVALSELRSFGGGSESSRNFGSPRSSDPGAGQLDGSQRQLQQRLNRPGHRHGPPRPTEPQLVAKLLELYPVDKYCVPISKWAQDMPEEVREALVAYGGLGNFTSSQANFFIVRTENGVKVVSLSTMGLSLCRERLRKERQDSKRAEKYGQRRGGGGQWRGRPQHRIQ